MHDSPDQDRHQGRCQDAFNSEATTVFDASAQRPLLHSMEAAGIPWPSSCRNGTCRTCVGRLLSGRVRYEMEWPGLSREEKEAGYVLPCAAYPCSDVVLREGY